MLEALLQLFVALCGFAVAVVGLVFAIAGFVVFTDRRYLCDSLWLNGGYFCTLFTFHAPRYHGGYWYCRIGRCGR